MEDEEDRPEGLACVIAVALVILMVVIASSVIMIKFLW